MSQHGGTRSGAGRKRGTRNRSPAYRLPAASAGVSPVEYMLSILHDENADVKDRAWAAEKAAPFLHPKPSPAYPLVVLDLPDTSTAEGVRDAIAAVVQAVAKGVIAPAEGQSLVSVIEAQRKAIETADILPRLEAIEARQAANDPGRRVA